MTRARDVADTQDNVGGAVPPFAAGKNKIINGDFGIWQRGTSFTNPAAGSYTADRFFFNYSGTFTGSITQQTFTPGTAPVAGYEGKFFLRINRTNSTSIAPTFYQRIEDVQTLAGQTVTFSFWAKADTSRALGMNYFQNFGSGGSGAVIASAGSASLTTSWQRFTTTFTMPSIAGKTIGTSSFVTVYFDLPDSATFTIDFWGFQLEAGSVATPFTTATGTLAGELLAAQRYYYRTTGQAAAANDLTTGYANNTTNAAGIVRLPVTMRVAPTCNASAAGDFGFVWSAGTSTITALGIDRTSPDSINLRLVTTGLTTGQGGILIILTGTSKWLEASAEL